MIYGINLRGELIRVSAYQKGSDVRLSGPHGSHSVHSSNSGNIDGWKREAELAWNMNDAIDIPVRSLDTDYAKSEVEALRAKAAEIKASLGL